jgi:uncharacterized Ntn-hydrolase superfamily protein
MTMSIVVREAVETGTVATHRFGVGVTTNNPGIGVFCPFVSEHGAVATQYGTHGDVGPRIRSYLGDGVRAADIVPAVLDAADGAATLQVHALCADSRAVHHGEDLVASHSDNPESYGDLVGPRYSIAGNTLENLETLTAMAASYESGAPGPDLAVRLLDALEAGDEAGGDAREVDARSAAIKVVDPVAGLANEWYNDIRVDASPTPLADLRDQYERASAYHETASAEW